MRTQVRQPSRNKLIQTVNDDFDFIQREGAGFGSGNIAANNSRPEISEDMKI